MLNFARSDGKIDCNCAKVKLLPMGTNILLCFAWSAPSSNRPVAFELQQEMRMKEVNLNMYF